MIKQVKLWETRAGEDANTKIPRSIILISMLGNDLVIYEYCSRGMIDKIFKLLHEEYGVEMLEQWHSMCG